jgi:hypothetical protein
MYVDRDGWMDGSTPFHFAIVAVTRIEWLFTRGGWHSFLGWIYHDPSAVLHLAMLDGWHLRPAVFIDPCMACTFANWPWL